MAEAPREGTRYVRTRSGTKVHLASTYGGPAYCGAGTNRRTSLGTYIGVRPADVRGAHMCEKCFTPAQIKRNR